MNTCYALRSTHVQWLPSGDFSLGTLPTVTGIVRGPASRQVWSLQLRHHPRSNIVSLVYGPFSVSHYERSMVPIRLNGL